MVTKALAIGITGEFVWSRPFLRDDARTTSDRAKDAVAALALANATLPPKRVLIIRNDKGQPVIESDFER